MPADARVICKCGLVGKYTGCSPLGGLLMQVAFACLCGAVWGFGVHKDDVEKYRG